MRTFALLPLNKPIEAKSRLSPILTSEERGKLALSMAKDVLDSLRSVETVLVCREDVKREFRDYEFKFLLQKGRGLGNAVEAANEYALQKGADATLFLPADVPLVSEAILQDILSIGENHMLMISPGRRGGLGMLYRRPPDVVGAMFTERSFDDNLELASSMNVDAFIYNNPELYSDIDTLEDIREFLKVGKGTRSYDFLKTSLGKIL
ncbi:MAG: 2-phospho-L-lactate guanylyltransferase [Candidatus Hydrothermarchaeota archaeon]|nr:2-phospho-L-lactate guanylyltransferase [Candidatus Hydrothermarchaeota archaeon]